MYLQALKPDASLASEDEEGVQGGLSSDTRIGSMAASPNLVHRVRASIAGDRMSRRGDFQAVIEAYMERGSHWGCSPQLDSSAQDKASRTVRVDINGFVFRLSMVTCRRIPGILSGLKIQGLVSGSLTLLKRSSSFPPGGRKPAQESSSLQLTFDRDPLVFGAVVDFVHNDELHVPRNVCPKVFARDLTFWGFSIEQVERCCFSGLINFLFEQDKLKQFQWFLYQKPPGHSDYSSELSLEDNLLSFSGSYDSLRARVWRVLDEPSEGPLAKVYFIVMCFFILLSFFEIAASTHPYFRVENATLSTNTLPHTPFSNLSTANSSIANLSTANSSIANLSTANSSIANFSTANSSIANLSTANSSIANLSTATVGSTNGSVPDSTGVGGSDEEKKQLSPFLGVLEYVCAGYLFVDYSLRLLFFPDLRYFLREVINITDGLAMLGSIFKFMSRALAWDASHYLHMLLNILQLLKILRFLRPMSKMTWFRLMYFTLRESYRDLLLVVTLLLFLSMIFSFLLYFMGKTFHDIPLAIWYSIITMTTVGYGDVVPEDLVSMLIGSVVAVFGVIVMTMTTPIFVSNFHSLYINAIVGRPSTLKKVQKELERTQHPTTSATSIAEEPVSIFKKIKHEIEDITEISFFEEKRDTGSTGSGKSRRSTKGSIEKGRSPMVSIEEDRDRTGYIESRLSLKDRKSSRKSVGSLKERKASKKSIGSSRGREARGSEKRDNEMQEASTPTHLQLKSSPDRQASKMSVGSPQGREAPGSEQPHTEVDSSTPKQQARAANEVDSATPTQQARAASDAKLRADMVHLEVMFSSTSSSDAAKPTARPPGPTSPPISRSFDMQPLHAMLLPPHIIAKLPLPATLKERSKSTGMRPKRSIFRPFSMVGSEADKESCGHTTSGQGQSNRNQNRRRRRRGPVLRPLRRSWYRDDTDSETDSLSDRWPSQDRPSVDVLRFHQQSEKAGDGLDPVTTDCVPPARTDTRPIR